MSYNNRLFINIALTVIVTLLYVFVIDDPFDLVFYPIVITFGVISTALLCSVPREVQYCLYNKKSKGYAFIGTKHDCENHWKWVLNNSNNFEIKSYD